MKTQNSRVKLYNRVGLGPGVTGNGLQLVLPHWWVGFGSEMIDYCARGLESGVSPLVGGAGFWGTWLRGPRCLRADARLLVMG